MTSSLRAVGILALALGAGCASEPARVGPPDGAVVGPFDLASADLAGVKCLPDPGTDGTPCTPYCPGGSGTVAVADPGGGCHCWYVCDPAAPLCPCGRSCEALLAPSDGGAVPLGLGACLAANGPGERCAADANHKPYGHGVCGLGLRCVNEDRAATHAYCMYECSADADCPRGSTCLPAKMPPLKICLLDSDEQRGKPLGAACAPGELCAIASLCDGVCRPQCDGPGDLTTCTGGTRCTAFTDGAKMKTAAWVCK